MIHYTKEYIGQLLERYMDGTSTLEEEDIIADYLKGNDVPEEWLPYQQMFQEIDNMRPKQRSKRWIGWSIAAAIAIALVAYVSVLSQQTAQQPAAHLIAKSDSTSMKQEIVIEKAKPDTVQEQPWQVQPAKPQKRSRRKPQPTINDELKASILMAETKRKQREAELQLMETEMRLQQEEVQAIMLQMKALGYVAVRHEDGTIYYINENEKDIVYEE
jgi:hypothetical protein